MATTAQKQRYIGEARQAMTVFIDAWATIANLRRRADDLGLLVSGPNQLGVPDFVGDNVDIPPADFIAAIQTADQSVTNANRQTITKVRY